MHSFSFLNEHTAVQFSQLTYPIYRSELKNLNSNTPLIAIGAYFKLQPVGLVLSRICLKENSAEVLSLFVVPEHRKCGLGKTLLGLIEKNLRQHGCSKVGLVYTPNATTPALEQILKEQHWSTPKPRMLICKSDTTKLRAISWLKLSHSLSPHYTIFPWIHLKSSERQAIQQLQKNHPWYPDILCPFKEENIIEPLNSLGLRYQDQVVGWMITHRLAADTIRYTSLFVKEELQSIGRAISLLATAINIQLENQETTKAICTVEVGNSQMVKFTQRRLAPYLTSITQSMGTSKLLGLDY